MAAHPQRLHTPPSGPTRPGLSAFLDSYLALRGAPSGETGLPGTDHQVGTAVHSRMINDKLKDVREIASLTV